MVLVTIGDIEDEAQVRGVDISNYSKSKLERMIQATQLMIEERTGRIFDKQEKEYFIKAHNSSLIRLPFSPIFNDETLEVLIDENAFTDFDVDTNKGAIHLNNMDYDRDFKVEVTYNAGYDPAYAPAVELALDILMFNIKGKEVDSSIDTVKEGDISIKYAKTGALPSDLESRLLSLQKPLMEIIYV